MKNQTKRHSRLNRPVPSPQSLIPILLLIVFLASCADMFQPKLPSTESPSAGSLDDLFQARSGEITQLEPPTRLYAAPYYSRSEIRLAWEASPGASYYKIERAVAVPAADGSGLEWEAPGEESYETLERFVYDTAYIDEIIKNPSLESPVYANRYYYRISAFNPARNLEESEPCEPEYAMLFRAPSNPRASDRKESTIEVRWEKSENAVSYEILRSASEDGLPASLGTVPANQTYYINTIDQIEQGREFFYIIRANNSFGNMSLQTKAVPGKTKTPGAPDSPIIRRSAGYGRGNSTNETRIEWSEVDNAAYYAVYRFSAVYRNSNAEETCMVNSSFTILSANTEKLFWVDTTELKPGMYYYYRVRAIGKEPITEKELLSPFSGPDSLKSFYDLKRDELDELAESFILSPPDTVVVEKEAGGTVTVRWLPPIGGANERESYHYTVWADSAVNGAFTHPAKSGVGSTTENEYVYARNVSTSGGQFFKVVTYCGGVESAASIVVAPVPAPARIQGVTERAFISADAAANINGVYPVKITWKKPETEDPYFYNVYRSTRLDGGFAKINETPLNADGSGNSQYALDGPNGLYSFIDRNETAKAGKKYHYRVVSLNQLGGGNLDSSEIRSGWGALTHTQYMLEYNKTMKAALKKLTYMYKSGSTDKLGTETKNGVISGTIYYDAAISGLGARIIIKLTNYAEFYVENAQENGVYFILNGNSNTSANMSSNGTMDGTMNCTGMYPGKVYYDKIEIKGGAAGGGTYGIEPEGFSRAEVSWTVGG